MSELSKLVRLKIGEASKEEIDFLSVLNSRIVGQSKGKAAAARALRRGLNKLRGKRGPIYKLLQIGKSRTGKTLTAETAALALHGDSTALIVVECENYKQPHQIQQLLGAPPSYVGYKDPNQKAEPFKIDASAKFAAANLVASRKGSKCPITIILLDEIEKASDEFLDVLLGIFDSGKISLGNNSEVDFTDCIFFMTSNLGMAKVERLAKRLGFQTSESKTTEKDIESVVSKELKRRFKPEFLKRINETVIFAPLTEQQLYQVVELEIGLLKQRVAEHLEPHQRFGLDIHNSARRFVFAKAICDDGGVAEIKQVLDLYISDVLGNELAKGTIKGGNNVIVSHEAGAEGLTFDVDPDANIAISVEGHLRSKSPEAFNWEVLQDLRRVAAQAVEENTAVRSFQQAQINLGTYLHAIAQKVHEQPTTFWQYMEICFHPEAAKLLFSKVHNDYWLWRLIEAASLQATRLPITVADVESGFTAIRGKEGLLSQYDYEQNRMTYAELTVRGLLILGKDKDGNPTIFKNRLFD